MTECFVVAFEQNTGSPNKNFSIKPVRHTLTHSPSVIAKTNSYAEPDLPSDNKRHRPGSYEMKTPLVESIFWQSLYVSNLLMGYELTMTTKDVSLGSTPYSWLPVEVIVVVSWLFKSYWNPQLSLFNPIELQEANSVLREGDEPSATISMMYGSGDNQTQYLPSESAGHRVPAASSQPTGSFVRLQYSDSGRSNRDPHQYLHSLGLNCFVHPCCGVCQFRPSGATPEQISCPYSENINMHSRIQHFDSGNVTQPMNSGATYINKPNRSVNDDVPMPGNVRVSVNDQIIIDVLLSLGGRSLPEENRTSCTLAQFSRPVVPSSSGCLHSGGVTHCQQALSNRKRRDCTVQLTCDVIVAGEDGQQLPCGKVCKGLRTLENHKRRAHTEQKTCDLKVGRKDGQSKPCGKTFKNALSLSVHKSRSHSGQQICEVNVIGADGQRQPCGKSCKNTHALSEHKRRNHGRHQTCEVAVVGDDGQQRPCGKVCENANNLSIHKRKHHTGQQTCDISVVGEDGQQRSCGTVCSNVQELSYHKSRYHSGQQICDMSMTGEDGELQPCGSVCKNAPSMAVHKSRYHSGNKTCDVTVVGEGGQQRPCGWVCKNAGDLSSHKKKVHTGQQTCEISVPGEDDQSRPCGMVYKNALSLAVHKSKVHTGQKTCDVAVVGENGQQQPCGTVCKNAQSLSSHKRKEHTGQRSCDVKFVGECGQERAYAKVCKSASALSDHKRRHRKRKFEDLKKDDDLNP
ncbi:hypothetical protein [Endozoicomonas sp. SESOKO4]|uniref:hypothetical protein n=1 Tax=Endozoicomonas sp. SESOKO4 TaxID=2828745 RepID=UPI0021492387|nr:hypothetical protein [Endozoicomonas sp. SESOKO4]